MDKEKAYHILNIDKNEHVDKVLLRKKYFKAALLCHPDKNKKKRFIFKCKRSV